MSKSIATKPLHQRIGAWLFRRIVKKQTKKLYGTFSHYPCPTTLRTTDPCGISPELDHHLTKTPLGQLDMSAIETLLQVSEVGQCSPELRYYIPRFFELLFTNDAVGLQYVEWLSDYIAYEYHNLTAEEKVLIDQSWYLFLSVEFSLPEGECDEMVVFAVALTSYDCVAFLRRIYLEEISRKLKKDPTALGKMVTVKERLVEMVRQFSKDMPTAEFDTWSNQGSRKHILSFINYGEESRALVMGQSDFMLQLMRALLLNIDAFSMMSGSFDSIIGKDSVMTNSMLFKGWSLRYNLFNPENFIDPVTAPDWYDPKINYEYYEKPFVDPTQVEISKVSEDAAGHSVVATAKSLTALEDFIAHKEKYEETLLAYLISYTFGNGGAYALGEHFTYAMQSISTFQGVTFTEETFMKELVQLRTIALQDEADSLLLFFDVAWDIEHGLCIVYKQGEFSVRV